MKNRLDSTDAYVVVNQQLYTPRVEKTKLLLGNRASVEVDFRFKVILLGDSKVGKSSIVNRIVDETFNNKYQETT